MTAADDVNLDDLKRRARRRLVGAIVLALVVAVVVPMLLESDPKPLGEDVAVRIPPVDDGKFVSRLSDKGKADAPKADAIKSAPRPETKTEGKTDAARAEGDSASRAPEPAKSEPANAVVPANADTGTAASKAEPAKAEAASGDAGKADASKGGTPAAQVASAAPASAAAAKAAPASANGSAIPAATPNGLFAVQVYAFSDVYGANSLVNKLKRVGYPAYSEPTTTSKGQLWRVRIGPFPSREVAATARDRLKGEGYNGIVTTK